MLGNPPWLKAEGGSRESRVDLGVGRLELGDGGGTAGEVKSGKVGKWESGKAKAES